MKNEKKLIERPLDHVITVSEASKIWGLSRITVQQACNGYANIPPKMRPDECRKSNGTWLVTKDGMARVFGKINIL